MGNKQKVAKPEVNIILDKEIYFPGENITGKIEILINIEQNLFDSHDPINLLFSIIQQKKWRTALYEEEDISSLNSTSDENGISDLAKNMNNIIEFSNFKGIQLPFKYLIPKDITPSLEWPHSKKEFAFIRNFLCVKIPVLEFEKQTLIFVQKLPSPIQNPLKAEKEFGNIKITGTLTQPSYAALGKIDLSVSVDMSESDKKIKEITVKLKRKLELKHKSSQNVKKKILQILYYETRKISNIKETLNFNIPFKDGSDIKYDFSDSKFKTNEEISKFLPNVKTNAMDVCYYIKIKPNVTGFSSKETDLKLDVDYYIKDEDKILFQINNKVNDNSNNMINNNNMNNNNANFPFDLYKTQIFSKMNLANNNNAGNQHEINNIPNIQNNENMMIPPPLPPREETFVLPSLTEVEKSRYYNNNNNINNNIQYNNNNFNNNINNNNNFNYNMNDNNNFNNNMNNNNNFNNNMDDNNNFNNNMNNNNNFNNNINNNYYNNNIKSNNNDNKNLNYNNNINNNMNNINNNMNNINMNMLHNNNNNNVNINMKNFNNINTNIVTNMNFNNNMNNINNNYINIQNNNFNNAMNINNNLNNLNNNMNFNNNINNPNNNINQKYPYI